ncbi:hypothetical protein D1007_27081 [Hordeum vulgare]|nr:hypothetical protein D1007_27081 [Hordeum vulgare]
MASLNTASWYGFVITEGNIEYLRRRQKLPSEELIEACTPREERVLEPRPGECIVFGTHLLVGFGLPGSIFLRQFLEFYGLQMHHLGPNSVLCLASFATLCDAYLVLWPFSSFFRHLFHFHVHMHRDVSYSCGCAVVYTRGGWPFSKDEVEGVLQKVEARILLCLQHRPGRYWVNLSPFYDEPPTGEHLDLDVCTDELG